MKLSKFQIQLACKMMKKEELVEIAKQDKETFVNKCLGKDNRISRQGYEKLYDYVKKNHG